MTNSQAMAIIKLHGRDILASDGMRLEHKFIQHGKISVFKHSLSVAIMCVMIAESVPFEVNRRSLVRGALLHDYFLYDWHEKDDSHRMHGFIHAKRALQNAKRDFELNEIEQNMIETHMFPLNLTALPKYKESAILCIADKIVATKETADGFIEKIN